MSPTEIYEMLKHNPTLMAGVVGIMLSLACTQVLKYSIPASWSDSTYRRCVRLIGFVTGWAFGFGAWHMLLPTSTTFADFYWASGVGFLGPATYSIIVPWICNRWPFLDKALSGRPNGTS